MSTVESHSAMATLFSQINWIQWLLIAGAVYFLKTLFYAFIFSPVKRVPGPWYARVSKIPLLWATYKHRRTAYVTAILKEYGEIVVIAPDQVHTTDDSAMKIIYDRNSLKTPFYASMGSWKGVTSTLGFIDYASAAPTRNNLIQCFQNKNLATLVEHISSHITEFTNLLHVKDKANESVDGVVVFRLLALDIVTDVLWGEENTLLSHIGQDAPVFLRRFHAFSSWNALKSFIPGVDMFVKYLGFGRLKRLRNDCNDMDITAREALKRWQNNPGESHREKDVLSMLQSMNDAEDPKKRVPNDHVPAYMVEMLAAGSSTTSHTATFVCWLLTRNEEAQRKLRLELKNAFPNQNEIDEKKIIDLPYTDAVIRETMRMYPMIPGPLERYVGKPITVAGKTIPGGVIASTAAYNQGRLADVFPDPDEWRPERWENANERMRLNWTPFGYGSRACPGANLAMTELKYMIGTIFRKFSVVLPPGHENDTLELADVFAAGSKSGHCWLKFVKEDD